jgi:hypothetical protein
MAKKEITEYQPAEDTSTVIQCDSCEKEWENRGIRGNEGVNTVILNAKIEQRRTHSGWSTESDRKWNGSSVIGDRPVRFTGEAINDYCHECWNSFFDEGVMIEVEKPEYYVDEVTKEQFYCDFCESGMGDEPSNTITLNPYITVEQRIHSTGTLRNRTEKNTATCEPNDAVSCGRYDKLYVERFDSFDCCDDCANDIFNLGRAASTESGESFAKAFAKGFKSVFFGV